MSAYDPNEPLRRPGGKPPFAPTYRVLIHKRQVAKWHEMVTDIGADMVDQCWDHLASDPANPPKINSTTKLKGKQFAATPDGFSAAFHYRVSSSWRVDYRYHNSFTGGLFGDSHRVSVIQFVGRSTSGT